MVDIYVEVVDYSDGLGGCCMRAMGLFVLASQPQQHPPPSRAGEDFASRSDTSAARVQDVGFFVMSGRGSRRQIAWNLVYRICMHAEQTRR
jgi:hypothetical protein